jgi:hypothetical protein
MPALRSNGRNWIWRDPCEPPRAAIIARLGSPHAVSMQRVREDQLFRALGWYRQFNRANAPYTFVQNQPITFSNKAILQRIHDLNDMVQFFIQK